MHYLKFVGIVSFILFFHITTNAEECWFQWSKIGESCIKTCSTYKAGCQSIQGSWKYPIGQDSDLTHNPVIIEDTRKLIDQNGVKCDKIGLYYQGYAPVSIMKGGSVTHYPDQNIGIDEAPKDLMPDLMNADASTQICFGPAAPTDLLFKVDVACQHFHPHVCRLCCCVKGDKQLINSPECGSKPSILPPHIEDIHESKEKHDESTDKSKVKENVEKMKESSDKNHINEQKVKDNDERMRKGKDEKECKEKSEDTYKKYQELSVKTNELKDKAKDCESENKTKENQNKRESFEKHKEDYSKESDKKENENKGKPNEKINKESTNKENVSKENVNKNESKIKESNQKESSNKKPDESSSKHEDTTKESKIKEDKSKESENKNEKKIKEAEEKNSENKNKLESYSKSPCECEEKTKIKRQQKCRREEKIRITGSSDYQRKITGINNVETCEELCTHDLTKCSQYLYDSKNRECWTGKGGSFSKSNCEECTSGFCEDNSHDKHRFLHHQHHRFRGEHVGISHRIIHSYKENRMKYKFSY